MKKLKKSILNCLIIVFASCSQNDDQLFPNRFVNEPFNSEIGSFYNDDQTYLNSVKNVVFDNIDTLLYKVVSVASITIADTQEFNTVKNTDKESLFNKNNWVFYDLFETKVIENRISECFILGECKNVKGLENKKIVLMVHESNISKDLKYFFEIRTVAEQSEKFWSTHKQNYCRNCI